MAIRQIEFRGKSKYDGRWHYGYLVYEIKDKTYKITDGKGLYYFVETETIGQFTGICDKNGTKIFEGDIVNICYEDDVIDNCVVVFGDYEVFRDDYGYRYSNCGFALKFNDGSGYTNLSSKNTYEIIGNIHDNPELMEVLNEDNK